MVLTVGSLFSGIGGIELGLEQAGGFETKWFVETDRYARAVLRKHWKTVPIYGDITQVDWTTVAPVDMLTGGFPCQDISYAGKGAGIKEGTRSGLWKEYYKAICSLRPKFVLVENVSALLTRGLDIVLGDLAQVGYDAEWHCITAASVGAPHRRDRIFILAYSNSRRRCREERFRESNSSAMPGQEQNGISNKNGEGCRNREVAYANGSRPFHRQLEKQSAEAREYAQCEPSECCEDVADSDSNGEKWRRQESIMEGSTKVSNANGERLQRYRRLEEAQKQAAAELTKYRFSTGAAQWSVEPSVGRVANGISSRVDRIKCLGNAVVPQVAQFVGKRIKEITFV